MMSTSCFLSVVGVLALAQMVQRRMRLGGMIDSFSFSIQLFHALMHAKLLSILHRGAMRMNSSLLPVKRNQRVPAEMMFGG